MNKFITLFTTALAVFAFFAIFQLKWYLCALLSIVAIILILIGFRIENYISNNGNEFLNRLIYVFTKNEKDYNIQQKEFICEYENKNYTVKKDYTLLPTKDSINTMNDRYTWSGIYQDESIAPLVEGQTVANNWRKNGWRCYSICFNKYYQKHSEVHTGIVIKGLIDDKIPEPFLYTTVKKKTKELILTVKIPRSYNITEAEYSVFSRKDDETDIVNEKISYDDNIGGFQKRIIYPRKGWVYAINWQID